jgi:hypothetical protein
VVGVVFRDDSRVLAIQRRDTGEWQHGGVLDRVSTRPSRMAIGRLTTPTAADPDA